jgi:hypothetical protein
LPAGGRRQARSGTTREQSIGSPGALQEKPEEAQTRQPAYPTARGETAKRMTQGVSYAGWIGNPLHFPKVRIPG